MFCLKCNPYRRSHNQSNVCISHRVTITFVDWTLRATDRLRRNKLSRGKRLSRQMLRSQSLCCLPLFAFYEDIFVRNLSVCVVPQLGRTKRNVLIQRTRIQTFIKTKHSNDVCATNLLMFLASFLYYSIVNKVIWVSFRIINLPIISFKS